MTVETAIAERIVTLTGVTDLVGQSVWVGVARQGARLGVLVHLVGGPGQRPHLRGMDGVVKSRVQVDAFAPRASGVDAYATASAIDAAIMGDGSGNGLSGWHGSVGSPGLRIDAVFPDGEPVNGYEAGPLEIFKVMRDYMVTYRWS